MKPLGDGDPLRLGPYRLLGVLGAGGMGKVYVGRDASGALAAVKVLRRELANSAHMVSRFQREAQTAQAVRSPGVARVLGVETGVGQLWIATEFLTGPTLQEAVEAYGPFDEEGIRALGAALAHTLRDIHLAGLVHRDIKPPNIVLTTAGPRVIDFGIARPEHGLTLTTTGQIPATPGYAPPEQVQGHRTGPPADLFALGAVLVYAASGRLAFDGASVPSIQYEVVHGQPDLSGVPPVLQQLMAACLAKEAPHRPTPEQLIQALAPPRGADRVWRSGRLAQHIAERQGKVDQYATLPGERQGPSRRKLLTGLGAGAAVLATVGAGGWWLLRERDGGGSNDADPTSTDAYRAKPLTEYEQGIAPEPLWNVPGLTHRDAGPPLVHRDRVIVHTANGGVAAHHVVDGAERWKHGDLRGAAGFLVGEHGVLAGAEDGTVRGFNAADGTDSWETDADAQLLLAASDDTLYVLTKDGQFRALDQREGKERWRAKPPTEVSEDAHHAQVRGERLLYCGADGSLVAVNTRTGERAWALGNRGERNVRPQITSAGVFVGGEDLLSLRLADGGEQASLAARGDNPWGAPLVNGTSVYVTSGADLYHLSTGLDQGEVWSTRLSESASPYTRPVASNRLVWVAGDEEEASGVTALLLDGGSVVWPYSRGARAPWQLTAADNRAYLQQNGILTVMPVY